MAMNLISQPATYTFDAFCAVVPDGQKADLIDGVIYMASPDNTDAGKLFMWLAGLMYDFAQSKNSGEVFGNRIAFRLNARNGPEPDIGYVRKSRLHLVQRGYVDGPPDLAVEIVSPESVERDHVKKRSQYQRAGVPEYWIVDELEKEVILLRLGQDGKYREVKPRKGELHSRAMRGFWIRTEWLWQSPLPNKRKILALLLSPQS
jgi:Uma2 family endonuclease